MTDGYKCAVCGAEVGVATPLPWRCPNATADDPHHVLHIVDTDLDTGPAPPPADSANPIVRYAARCAWWAFAGAHGMSENDRVALAVSLADGFVVTPLMPSEVLSRRVGCQVWVKDETGNLAGSHKARHLIGILLHLAAAERLGLLADEHRPPLAIASCGNAAIAAATLAQRSGWPIDVYVPDWMSDAVGAVLGRLGARIHRCERRPGDPAGDPAMLRFREAVAEGAVPFSVQGPENALALDTGRTLGWEIGDQLPGDHSWRVLVQVGGGALAACVGAGLGPSTRLDTVQTEGCAPLAAAWDRLGDFERPEQHWSQVMRAWPNPHSLADGILDDETYDWIADVHAMRASGGAPIVAAESHVVEAHELAVAAGFDASATGSAGLAGALAIADQLQPDDHLVVVMSGVAR